MAVNQFVYRGRNDDGNETTATWKAAENTAWTQAVNVNFRVRFKMQNDTAQILNLDVQLQYNKNGAGWNNVNASSLVVRSSASANLADAANLTEQLTGGTGTFIGATAFDEVNGICGGNSLDVTATGKFETEFCCQLRSADVVQGDTIQLRTINSDSGSAWATYTVTGSMTAHTGAYSMVAAQASYTLTGQVTGLTAQRLLTAAQASYTHTGQAATMAKSIPIAAEQSSFAFSGRDASFIRHRILEAGQVAFALNGQASTFRLNRVIQAERVNYVLTGQPATLTHDGGEEGINPGDEVQVIQSGGIDCMVGITGTAVRIVPVAEKRVSVATQSETVLQVTT